MNNELANSWGNLVNRTVSMAYKNFGEVPQPGAFTVEDEKLLTLAAEAYDVVGDHLENSRFKQGINHAMHVVGEANAYIAEMEPWKLAKDESQRERLATVLWVALQVVSDCNTLLTPYIPHIAQTVHETLGRDGEWAAQPQVVEVVDDSERPLKGVDLPPEGRLYLTIQGDYTRQQAAWKRTEMVPGTPLKKPKPIVQKLDTKLAETGPEWAPVQ